MNLQHLNYFMAIKENGSISKAAEVLHVSQPSLSRIMKGLEAEVGAPLLCRTARGVVLTADGQLLYDHVKRALTILEDSKTKIRVRASKERLVIYTTGDRSTLNVIGAFRKENPGIEVEERWVPFDMQNFIYPEGGEQECSICVIPEGDFVLDPGKFNLVRFHKISAWIISRADHWLSGYDEISLSDLMDETLVLPMENSVYALYAKSMFRQQNFIPKTEARELCEEPMNRLSKALDEISLVYQQNGIPVPHDMERYIMLFWRNLIETRNDLVLMYTSVNRKHGMEPHGALLTGPGSERCSYMIWPKEQGQTASLLLFVEFIRNRYNR
ncbi:MAG: LysR family transcriptional regulator [Clostridiales bacterium]|nr:LysR family transcriptional regulator [Clostridiales bacterium]